MKEFFIHCLNDRGENELFESYRIKTSMKLMCRLRQSLKPIVNSIYEADLHKLTPAKNKRSLYEHFCLKFVIARFNLYPFRLLRHMEAVR